MTTTSGVCVTSSTGGTGSLQLQIISSGYLANCGQYSDILGTSGNPVQMDYHIHEFTDSTHLTLLQSETGTCPLIFSAGNAFLNRAAANTVLWHTWNQPSTQYLPSANYPSTVPTQLTIGSTPANITISLGPFAGATYPVPRFINSTNLGTGSTTIADGLGVDSFNAETVNGSSFQYYNANTIIYTPYYVMTTGFYQTATIFVVSSPQTGALGRVAIYDVDNKGWFNNLRCDWSVNGGSDFDMSSTGLKSSTLSTPIYLTTGWYGIAFISNIGNGIFTSGVSVTSRTNVLFGPLGTSNGAIIQAGTIQKGFYEFLSVADPYSTITPIINASGTSVPVILLQQT